MSASRDSLRISAVDDRYSVRHRAINIFIYTLHFSLHFSACCLKKAISVCVIFDYLLLKRWNNKAIAKIDGRLMRRKNANVTYSISSSRKIGEPTPVEMIPKALIGMPQNSSASLLFAGFYFRCKGQRAAMVPPEPRLLLGSDRGH